MNKPGTGYTIIEVMIVFAIGAILFIAATTVFSGKQGRTQFTLAMQDVESQIRASTSDVRVSLFPGAGLYDCDIVGGRPILRNPTGGNTAGNQDKCIYLGKALQADSTANPGKIYTYTVLGSRQNPVGTDVTQFAMANPEPIMGPPSVVDLTETFNIPGSAKIKWSKISTTPSAPLASAPNTDLVGFYNSLQTTTNSGSQSLYTVGYPGFTTNAGNPQNQVKQTLQDGFPLYPRTAIAGWYLCFDSGTSNQTALMTVSTSSAGITTKTDYSNC